jgi:hypothetical protein
VSKSRNILYNPNEFTVGVNSEIYETLIDGIPYDLDRWNWDENFYRYMYIDGTCSINLKNVKTLILNKI